MIELCNCQCSHHINCLMQCYQASKSFAEYMGGCHCPCHFTEHGALIPSGEWLNNRYAVARAMQLASQERHTDPRIEALMPQEVKER